MQRIFTTLFFCFLFFSLSAQTRYLDEMFSITKHSDIQYGSNYDSKNQLTNLLMDVYEPQVDTAQFRPIIFFVHGGSFIGGDRSDQSINETAEFFAKKGYVTANIEYRLDQTVFIDPIVNFADTYNWHRAIARATQDLKAAIRFFKKDVATNGNSYKVDTTKIIIYGSSAGAITALHTAFLDDTLEMNSVTKISFNEVGGLDGNSGNPGYSSTAGIKAVVSCSGAIEDLNWINNNRNIEYLGFHNNPDFLVPFDIGCFATVACWLGQYYGDNKIFPKVKSFGTHTEFYPINIAGHPVDQVSDTATHRFILQKTTEFLYKTLTPTITTSIKNNLSKSFDLFPNPTNGSFNITIPNELLNKETTVEIVDATGQQVFATSSMQNTQLSINANLSNGIYIVMLKSATQNYISKLVIEK